MVEEATPRSRRKKRTFKPAIQNGASQVGASTATLHLGTRIGQSSLTLAQSTVVKTLGLIRRAAIQSFRAIGRSFFIGWIKNFRSELKADSGWKLLGQLLAGTALIWGVFNGLMTYHSHHLTTVRENAERSYNQLASDLGSDSARSRIAAITRIPSVMLRQVPESDIIGVLDAIRLTFGGKTRTTTLYCEDMQRLLHVHFASLNNSNANWSVQEVDALIDVLIQLGADGWYDAKVQDQVTDPKKGLAWVWSSKSVSGKYQTATNLFEQMRLDGINLSNYDLDDANFRGAKLLSSDFSYCHLQRATFSQATLSGADLSQAQLSYSQFEGASVDEADLSHAYLMYTNFKYALLTKTKLQESDLTSANFLGAKIERANLRKATLTNANLQNVSLDAASLSNANLNNTDISFGSLKGCDLSNANLHSANLSNSSLENSNLSFSSVSDTNFQLADLRGVDFSNVTDLYAAKSWVDANIANVRGLSDIQIAFLLSRGAIQISVDDRFRGYKERGRPHADWRDYENGKMTIKATRKK